MFTKSSLTEHPVREKSGKSANRTVCALVRTALLPPFLFSPCPAYTYHNCGLRPKQGSVCRCEREHGRPGLRAGPVHHRKPGHRPRRRPQIRHFKIHGPQGYSGPPAPLQPPPRRAGHGGAGRKQGPAAHPGRAGHP